AGRQVVAARHGARARRRHPHAAHQRARARHVALEDARLGRGRAGERRAHVRELRALVRARGGGISPPYALAPRRLFAQPLRHHRSRLVLCRHALRAGPCRRPQLHAGAAGRRQRRAARCALRCEFPPLPDGERDDAARHALLRRRFRDGSPLRRAGKGPRCPCCTGSWPGHVRAGRARLGGRDPPRDRGARQPVARCAFGPRGESPLRRAGDHGDAHLRPPLGLAELDLQPAQRRRREGRLEALRQRLETTVQPGESLMAIDYQERIPNNVDLAENRTLQRALEHWQPRFLDWWRGMGPTDFLAADVYLRTATSVDAKGWATYGSVKMPDYRWGIFLADAVPDRRIGFGDEFGKPAWQQVPGEHRSTLRRLIVTQGDTEPASVEQQRLLGHSCPSLYDLRNLFQINVEEGRHLWAMVYLLHAYFGRDGREEAEE